MPTIYARNCPEELYERVKSRATASHRSVAAEVFVLLDEALSIDDPVKRRLQALAELAEIRRRNPLPPGAVDSLTLLREDRER